MEGSTERGGGGGKMGDQGQSQDFLKGGLYANVCGTSQRNGI